MTSLKTRINFNKLRNKKEKLKTTLKVKKPKKVKVKREKKRRGKIGYAILTFITAVALMIFVGAIGFGIYVVYSAPDFDPKLLYEKEATNIYDSEGFLIASLGISDGSGIVEKREKVTYEDLPQVLIDAIVATEDSRYFQHNGFDLARFSKAALGQLLGNSDAGGGSTLTMQVVKNTWTSRVDTGLQGIIRKFTDIYMAIFKLEKNYTKEEIMEFYVNGPFLGSGSYGVEQASQTYFGKSVSDLSLSEAALIAGLFQAPSSYDPYVYPENAEGRRNIVLNLMVRHGYITESIAEEAKQIKVKDMLVTETYNSVNEYQGFIDTAVREVIALTKQDPYNTPMEIYTTMVRSKQDVINDLYDGTLGYTFKDDFVQVGVTVVDNDTGAMIAVGAGRNKTTELSLNYATMINRHPGSTAKPLFDYGPGIEYLKWSTYTPFFDEPEIAYSSGKTMNNSNNKNAGLITMKKSLIDSVNTSALQAFQSLDNNLIYDFVTSLGITPETSDGYLHEAHAVGAFNGVSPKELAGAYAAFANGGYYTEPYSVTKVIYRDSGETYEPKHSREKVMSEQTAYMMTTMLLGVTTSRVSVSGTQVASKTGTSTYDYDTLKKRGLSTSLIQDSWCATYSPDYTMSIWYGYDKLMDDYNMTMNIASYERSIIQGKLVNNMFEKNSKFSVPSGVSAVKVELETLPAQRASEFTPSDLQDTFYFVKGTEPTETSTRFSRLEDPTNVEVTERNGSTTITWTPPATPTAIDENYLAQYFNNSFKQWAQKYYNLRLTYNETTIGTFGFDIYLKNENETKYIGFTTDDTYTVPNTLGYNEIIVKSAYSVFKDNASIGVSKTITGASASIQIELIAVDGFEQIHPTIKVNTELPDLGLSSIKVLLNNVDVTSTIDKSAVTLSITDRVSGNKINKLSDIDLTKSGWYQITYKVTYLGVTYSSDKRSLYIEK